MVDRESANESQVLNPMARIVLVQLLSQYDLLLSQKENTDEERYFDARSYVHKDKISTRILLLSTMYLLFGMCPLR